MYVALEMFGNMEQKNLKFKQLVFLTDDEACKIKDFILYVYNYSSSGIGREKISS